MLSLQAFGKVVPIRFKRLENQGRTAQRNSTIDHESDSSVPTNISHPVSTSSQPGFEEPATGFPSTVYPWGASPTHLLGSDESEGERGEQVIAEEEEGQPAEN